MPNFLVSSRKIRQIKSRGHISSCAVIAKINLFFLSPLVFLPIVFLSFFVTFISIRPSILPFFVAFLLHSLSFIFLRHSIFLLFSLMFFPSFFVFGNFKVVFQVQEFFNDEWNKYVICRQVKRIWALRYLKYYFCTCLKLLIYLKAQSG